MALIVNDHKECSIFADRKSNFVDFVAFKAVVHPGHSSQHLHVYLQSTGLVGLLR